MWALGTSHPSLVLDEESESLETTDLLGGGLTLSGGPAQSVQSHCLS